MTSHRQYVERAGYTLEHPSGENLLLLLHGLGGDRSQPLSLVRGLARDDLAILAPDARAHGETSVVGGAADFHFDEMVDDLLELLRETGQMDKPTYVAGISMGAAIALRTARRTALDVRGLSLVRPAFTTNPVPENLAIMLVIEDLLTRFGSVKGLAMFDKTVEFSEILAISPSHAESLRQQFTKRLAQERAPRLRYVPENTAFPDNTTVDADFPVLIVGSRRDPVHPIEIAHDWARRIPRSEFVEVPAKDDNPLEYESDTRVTVQRHALGALNLAQ